MKIAAFPPNLVLVLGGPSGTVDLDAGVVGTVETHRALADDPRIVTAVVSGSRLTLIPAALGTTIVTLSASNSTGSVIRTFWVSVVAGSTSRVRTVQSTAALRIEAFPPDLTLTLGGASGTVDLEAGVAGTVESHSAWAANPRIVTAVVSGSTLTLIPAALGTTVVTLSASNSRGSVVRTFRVTVTSG